MEGTLRRRYPNYKLKGSFSGAFNFKKDTGTSLNIKDVKKVLQKIPAYTLHEPRRIHFDRRRVYVPHMTAQFGMDLKDIQSESRYNNKKRYLLVVINMFSRMAYIEPLSKKTGIEVVKGLTKIFSRCGPLPQKIQVDKGTEFYNEAVKRFLTEKGIQLFSVQSGLKCVVIERFIRTIFGKIQRYLTHNNTRKFVDKLEYFENLYNNSYHRMIKMRPIEVCEKNSEQVHDNLYLNVVPTDYKKPKFFIGDKVLVARRKTVFQKGYKQNYLPEVFKIKSIRQTTPNVYSLVDKNDTPIKETFYAEQLVKVDHS